MESGDKLDSVFARAARLGGQPHSSVGSWLLQNARGFADRLSKFRKIPWRNLSVSLHEEFGIGDSNGKPLTGRALCQAWYRVRVYLKDQGEDWVEFRDPPRGARRLVKRRKVTPTPAVAGKPVPAKAAPVSAEPDAIDPQLQELLAEMSASRPWVPKAKG